MGRACGTQGEMRNVYIILIGKPERRKLFSRPIGEPGWPSGMALTYELDDRGFESGHGLGIFL
jgi:hypothetical protein